MAGHRAACRVSPLLFIEPSSIIDLSYFDVDISALRRRNERHHRCVWCLSVEQKPSSAFSGEGVSYDTVLCSRFLTIRVISFVVRRYTKEQRDETGERDERAMKDEVSTTIHNTLSPHRIGTTFATHESQRRSMPRCSRGSNVF